MDMQSSAPDPGATGTAGPNAPGAAPDAQAPAPTPASPAQPHGFFASVRRSGLYREDDRWIGGVASGVATRFNLDPLLIRGLFGVSILLGGLGLVLYGVGWALLPERRDGRIHLEETIAGRFDAAILGALVFVVVGLSRGDHWFLWWDGDGWLGGWFAALLWIAVIVTLVVVVVTSARNRSGRPRPTSPYAAPAGPYGSAGPYGTAGPADAAGPATTDSTVPTSPAPEEALMSSTQQAPAGAQLPPGTAQPYVAQQYGGYAPRATSPYGTYAGQPPVPPVPPVPPRPPKPRAQGPGVAALGAVVALSLLALAALLVGQRNETFDGPVLLTGAGIAIILLGLGIIVSGLRGRTSGLLGFLAIVGILFTLPAAAVADIRWWDDEARQRAFADSTYVVQSRSVAERGYVVGAGDAVIDLTEVPLTSETLDVPIQMGAGSVRVVVPADASVVADVNVFAGEVRWQVDGSDDVMEGVIGTQRTYASAEAQPGEDPQLHLQVRVGAGEIVITEEER